MDFNFGLPGVFVGMIIAGWLLAYVRDASRRSPMLLTFSALLVGMFVLIVATTSAFLCARCSGPRSGC